METRCLLQPLSRRRISPSGKSGKDPEKSVGSDNMLYYSKCKQKDCPCADRSTTFNGPASWKVPQETSVHTSSKTTHCTSSRICPSDCSGRRVCQTSNFCSRLPYPYPSPTLPLETCTGSLATCGHRSRYDIACTPLYWLYDRSHTCLFTLSVQDPTALAALACFVVDTAFT